MVEVAHCSFGSSREYHDLLHIIAHGIDGTQYIIPLNNVNPDFSRKQIIDTAIFALFGVDPFESVEKLTHICNLTPKNIASIASRSDSVRIEILRQAFPQMFPQHRPTRHN